jgi:transcriptional regulator with XRE-family HTH domain
LRQALRLSTRAFASYLGLGVRTIAKWEAGGANVTPRPDTQSILDTALARADDDAQARFAALLTQARVPTRIGEQALVSAVISTPAEIIPADFATPDAILSLRSTTVDLMSELTRFDFALSRRQVSVLAGLMLGTSLLEPLEQLLAAPSNPHRRNDAGRVAIGGQQLDEIDNAARLFRSWDHQFGGGLRRKAVVGQLNEVSDLLRDAHPEDTRKRLLAATAHLSETAAVMSWDSGQQATAQRYYLLALRAAREADDHAFTANVIAGMARQLLYLGHANDALELVRVARDRLSEHITPKIRSILYTREAWAYANLERASAFRRATDKAESAMAEPASQPEPYWITYFDAAEFTGTTGGRLLDLARTRPKLAEETATVIARAVTLRQPPILRSTALDNIGLAEARLIQGELDEAARVGHAALDLAEQTASDRVRVKLSEFYEQTSAHRAVPPIAELRERIRPPLAPPNMTPPSA